MISAALLVPYDESMTLPTMKDGRVTRLAVARVARGWHCYQLARVVGVEANSISAWERGHERPPHSKVARIALALGWSLDDLVGPPLDYGPAHEWLCRCRRDLVESGWPGPPAEDWAVGLFK